MATMSSHTCEIEGTVFRGIKGIAVWLIEPLWLDRWLKPIPVWDMDLASTSTRDKGGCR